MLIFENDQIVGNTAPNIYQSMKPWNADNGAYRWIVDNATGSPFTDSDGTTYNLRLRTPSELSDASAANAPENERKRLTSELASMDTSGVIALDNKGDATVTHSLGSLWYAVIVTPCDEAMPDIHVERKKNKFIIKGGAANGCVAYLLSAVSPEKGRENQLLTDPS